MRNIKLTLSYDGTAYHGFQRQKNAITVQQVLEEALKKVLKHEITVAGAARTDTGVHAMGQVVNFYTQLPIPVSRLPFALNAVLPQDIAACTAEEVDETFHARYSANRKTYEYKIFQAVIKSPFLRNYAWHIKEILDVEAMQQAITALIGTHDFTSFRASGSIATNPVRTIFEASCQKKDSQIIISLTGSGFLYHMVRNIVGTLVKVGGKKITVEQFTDILAKKDRKFAGKTAPGHGLYLKKVYY